MPQKKLTVLFLLLLIVFINIYAEETPEADQPPIENYRNLLYLRVTTTYNFISFKQASEENMFFTNRPWDFGMGFGVKNIFAGFSFSIPVGYDKEFARSSSYDFNFNRFSKKNNYSNAFLKYYKGFNNREDYVDLSLLKLGLTQTFILNKNHSLRSVYVLDRRQTVSNGSFLVGGGMYFSSIHSESILLQDYYVRLNTFYLGPNFGYSHTFVIADHFFINAYGVGGINLLISGWDFAYGLQAMIKLSFGYHSTKWSGNIYADYSYLINRMEKPTDNDSLSGKIGISYIRRFL